MIGHDMLVELDRRRIGIHIRGNHRLGVQRLVGGCLVVTSLSWCVAESIVNSRNSHSGSNAFSLVRSWLSALPFGFAGSAFARTKTSVIFSSESLYVALPSGSELSATQRSAQARTSGHVCLGIPYSKITENGRNWQPTVPLSRFCTPKMNRPSPALPRPP